MIDDVDFNRITRQAIEGREEDSAQETGIDLNVVQALRDGRAGSLFGAARHAFDEMADEKWFGYQFLRGHYEEPVALLRIEAVGVAGISHDGQAVLSSEFLIVVTFKGKGRPDEADIQWLMKLTPIWHPQVSSLGEIASNGSPESWSGLVRSLRELIAYESYQTDRNVLNLAAARWAEQNALLFPLDAGSIPEGRWK